jgi:hypothetical protein
VDRQREAAIQLTRQHPDVVAEESFGTLTRLLFLAGEPQPGVGVVEDQEGVETPGPEHRHQPPQRHDHVAAPQSLLEVDRGAGEVGGKVAVEGKEVRRPQAKPDAPSPPGLPFEVGRELFDAISITIIQRLRRSPPQYVPDQVPAEFGDFGHLRRPGQCDRYANRDQGLRHQFGEGTELRGEDARLAGPALPDQGDAPSLSRPVAQVRLDFGGAREIVEGDVVGLELLEGERLRQRIDVAQGGQRCLAHGTGGTTANSFRGRPDSPEPASLRTSPASSSSARTFAARCRLQFK